MEVLLRRTTSGSHAPTAGINVAIQAFTGQDQ
jgi:hypothetical protein